MAISIMDYGAVAVRSKDYYRREGVESGKGAGSWASNKKISEEAVAPVSHDLARGRAHQNMDRIRDAMEQIQERLQQIQPPEDAQLETTDLTQEFNAVMGDTANRVADEQQARTIADYLKVVIVRNTALSQILHGHNGSERILTLMDTVRTSEKVAASA